MRRAVSTLLLCSLIPQTLAGPVAMADGWFAPPMTTVQRLARQIDVVQRHLDDYGTIAPKAADVWGESRILRHREEFEIEMARELNKFEFRLQAAESTRDAAFLGAALALSSNLGGTTGTSGDVPNPNSLIGGGTGAASTTGNPTSVTSQLISQQASVIPPGSTTPITLSVVPRSQFSGPTFASTFGNTGTNTSPNLRLEPSLVLDQKQRFLNHLNEIRRLNEGDDLADSPGAALNLIRIPISVLPGKQTRKGFGAEVTVTIQPHLSEELLPSAFRDFVINGVVDRIAPRITALINRDSAVMDTLKQDWADLLKSPAGAKKNSFLDNESPETVRLTPQEKSGSTLATSMTQFTGSTRRPRLSLPRTHELDVDGRTFYPIAIDASLAMPSSKEKPIHLEDVRRYLSREVAAAYDYLSQPNGEILWTHCTPELAVAIREYRRWLPADLYQQATSELLKDEVPRLRIKQARKGFFDTLEVSLPDSIYSTTSSLAWQIIVESTLLNEQLAQDMRRLAAHRNCRCMPTEWQQFFGPNPPPEARLAFNEYVRCRWPIHVFALDPVTQDQNIGSSFSQRRELQMALAVAAASGRIGMQQLTQFTRRMEYDLETIDLNRTAVGFTHADDTFGWRFYPRVQAPPVPSNLQVITHDLLIGGRSRDADLKHRMLEPGIRECTALVVMPSFVPYLMVDVRTNWFRLTDCHLGVGALQRKMNTESAVNLSRDVTLLRELSAACVEDEHLYRDGETHRLCRAVEQIERSLPLQTSYVQIPYENRLGGFEIFNSGRTDLGPELIDWYGGKGILVTDASPEARSTYASYISASRDLSELESRLTSATINGDTALIATLTKARDDATKIYTTAKSHLDEANSAVPLSATSVYLVGRRFTSLGAGTRIIAGGIDVSDTKKTISRDVIQISVPSTAMVAVEEDDAGKPGGMFVYVHLATPQGTTGRLKIPAVPAIPSELAEPAATAVEALAAKVTAVQNEVKGVQASVKGAQEDIDRVAPIQAAWVSTDLQGCADVYRDGSVAIQIDTNPALQLSLNVPFSLVQAKLAGWVSVKVKGGKLERLTDRDGKPIAIRPITVLFDATRGRSGPLIGDCGASLQDELVCALQRGQFPKDVIEEIQIESFVRAVCGVALAEGPTATLPGRPVGEVEQHIAVIPLEKPLTIKVKSCCPEQAAPVLPTPAAPTPAK